MGANQKSGICAECGSKIVGAPFRLNGKLLCGSCYKKELQARAEEEQSKKELRDYIKTLFGVESCPAFVANALERMQSEGKKLSGIRYTIYYYYEIMGNPAINTKVGEVPWIVRDYYEEARDYVNKMAELAKQNELVDIKTEPIRIKIKQPSRRKRVYRRWDDTED